MVIEDYAKTERSLTKVKRVCKVINIVVISIFILFCITWLFATGIMICSVIGFEVLNNIGHISIIGLSLFIINGLIIGAIFIILINVFSDVSKGKSPFSMTQVKRLHLIALLLAFYAIVDIFNVSNSAALQFNGMDSGYITTSDNTIYAFNISPMIASAVIFAFSFVFKYGVLLQEFSDETL